jgi:Uma2 family endonuclease
MKTATLLSEKEFLNLPEFVGRQELMDGELIELPPAKYSHNAEAMHFLMLLVDHGYRDRVHMECAYRLRTRRWLIPDVSVNWPDQRTENDWLQGSPMVAIEIASRGNTAEYLRRKVSAFLEDGAEEVWVVYPKTCKMVVHRRDGTILNIAPDAEYVCALLGVTITPADRAYQTHAK